jgi:hypothetical protein
VSRRFGLCRFALTHYSIFPALPALPAGEVRASMTSLCCDEGKSWIPAFAGTTGWAQRGWVNHGVGWDQAYVRGAFPRPGFMQSRNRETTFCVVNPTLEQHDEL